MPDDLAPSISDLVPDLRVEAVQDLGGGWDSRTIEVNGEWIFRLPKREEVAHLLRKEIALLPQLGPQLPLPIPVIEWSSETDPVFLAYRKISGEPILQALASEQLASEIGAFLTALHTFPISKVLSVAPSEVLLHEWRNTERAFVERLRATVLPLVDDPSAENLLDMWVRAVEDAEFRPVLVHADIGPAHILCDDEGITGVIDWSDARVADPAIDLAWLTNGLDAAFGSALLTAYSQGVEVNHELVTRAELYHRLGPWHEVLYGLESADPTFVESGLEGVRNRLPS